MQERLLAALAVCACHAAQLNQLGAAGLMMAFHQSNNTASRWFLYYLSNASIPMVHAGDNNTICNQIRAGESC